MIDSLTLNTYIYSLSNNIKIEDYTNRLKELDCWKEEYEKLEYTQLFKILKIAKVFYVLKEKVKAKKYSNSELLDLYDTLYKKSFNKEYKDFREFLTGKTDREKIAIIKKILGIVFSIKESKERYSITIE